MMKKTCVVVAGSRRIAACGESAGVDDAGDAESDRVLEIVIGFDPHGRSGGRIGAAGGVY